MCCFAKLYYEEVTTMANKGLFTSAARKPAKTDTINEAGLIASQAGVKHVILNHFSARHPDTKELGEEARKIHSNVLCAKDFLEIDLD